MTKLLAAPFAAYYKAHYSADHGHMEPVLIPAAMVAVLTQEGVELRRAIKLVAEMHCSVRREDVCKIDTEQQYTCMGEPFDRRHQLEAKAWQDYKALAGKLVIPGSLTVYVKHSDTAELSPKSVVVRVDADVDVSDIVNWQDRHLDPTYGCTIVDDPNNEVPPGATSAFMDGRSYCLDPEKSEPGPDNIVCLQPPLRPAHHRGLLPAKPGKQLVLEVDATPWLNHPNVEAWLRKGPAATWLNPFLPAGAQSGYRDVFTIWDHGEGPDSPDAGGVQAEVMPQWLWDNIELTIADKIGNPKDVYCIVRLMDTEA